MLALARTKLPDVGFFRQDMTKFSIRKKFDVVICVFDSINHLLRFSDWRKFFRRVASHLARDGLFIFDINTVGKLRRLVKDPIWVKQFARGLVFIDVTDGPGGIVYWNLKVFERQKGDVFRLFGETIKEVSFPLNSIKEALKDQFTCVRVINPTGPRVSDQSDRLFLICKAR
jgi:SAM-dependent methyltransferase